MRKKIAISVVISLAIILGTATQTGSTADEQAEHPPSTTQPVKQVDIPDRNPRPDPTGAWDSLMEQYHSTSTTTTTTTTVPAPPPTTTPPTTTTPPPPPTTQPAPPVDHGSVWDRLAQCESGGDWSINTGNGYSGGIQAHPQTWNGYGGQEFAPYAWQATREQQIIVAERILAGQGWGAWPACSRQLGLR